MFPMGWSGIRTQILEFTNGRNAPMHTTESTTTTSAPLPTDTTTVESTSVTSVETSVSGAVTSVTESTVETTTETVNGSTPDYEDCKNNPDIDCRMYNAEITCAVDGKYYPWAKANCPLYCGYCQVPTIAIKCEDKLTTCDEYQADLCSNHLFRLFREKNCRKFCGICRDVDYAYAQPLSALG